MECIKCSTELPANVKFCPECGTKVENSTSNVCTNCGQILKLKAKFCHVCGAVVESGFKEAPVEKIKDSREFETGNVRRNWLATIGPLFFIPIFAGIIVLLFWKNKDIELEASNSMAAEQSMPSMEAMEQVHKTLERLKANVQANPEDLVSIDSLAQMYYIANSFEKASKYLEMHLEIEPGNRDIRMFLAMAYSNLNRADEAKVLIDEILQKEPTYAFGLYNLGLIYASQGNEKEALKNWNILVRHHRGTEVANMAQQRIHELAHVDQSDEN